MRRVRKNREKLRFCKNIAVKYFEQRNDKYSIVDIHFAAGKNE